MWFAFKYILIAIGVLAGIVLFCVAIFFYFSHKMAVEKSAAIEKLCRLPPGTPIDQILPLARELGVKEEGELSALGRAIEIKCDDPGVVINEADDQLPGFEKGSITIGQTVISPFERHYCKITIKDRKVVSTKKRILD